MRTKSILVSLSLTTTILSTPTTSHRSRDPDTHFNGPSAWQFSLTSFSGPGCPDFNAPSTPGYMRTNLDIGPIYNSSLSTYWDYISLPFMQAQLLANDTSRMTKMRCTLDIHYEEVTEYGGAVKEGERTHRLMLHKNSSLVMAHYGLDGGVVVEWQVRFVDPVYLTIERIDQVQLEGPLDTGDGEDMKMDWVKPLYTSAPYLQPQCGSADFRIRFDLSIAGRKVGVGGTVESVKEVWNPGEPLWSGVKLGFSFDWEKC